MYFCLITLSVLVGYTPALFTKSLRDNRYILSFLNRIGHSFYPYPYENSSENRNGDGAIILQR